MDQIKIEEPRPVEERLYNAIRTPIEDLAYGDEGLELTVEAVVDAVEEVIAGERAIWEFEARLAAGDVEQEIGRRRCERCRYWREDPSRSPAIPRSGRCESVTVSREVASSPITTSYSFGCMYWDALRPGDRDERLREAEAAAIALYDYVSNLQRAFEKALRDLDKLSIRHFGQKDREADNG